MEKIVAKNLISGLKMCFCKRLKREKFATQEIFPRLCPLIKVVRDVANKCAAIKGVINPSLILNIAKQISEELSPTAAEAGGYDRIKTIALFDKEFDDRIQELLDVCLKIDCCSAPGAPSNQIKKFEIEPMCRKVEECWGQIVKLYIKKVCVLGWFGKKNIKDQIEIRIKQSVVRKPDWGNLGTERL